VQNDEELSLAREALPPERLQIVSRRPEGRPDIATDLGLRGWHDKPEGTKKHG
jgi:hypothetical protein